MYNNPLFVWRNKLIGVIGIWNIFQIGKKWTCVIVSFFANTERAHTYVRSAIFRKKGTRLIENKIEGLIKILNILFYKVLSTSSYFFSLPGKSWWNVLINCWDTFLILNKFKYYPYNSHISQALRESDLERRLLFWNKFLEICQENSQVLLRTYESKFTNLQSIKQTQEVVLGRSKIFLS